MRLEIWRDDKGLEERLVDGWNSLGLVWGWAAYEAFVRPLNCPILATKRLEEALGLVRRLDTRDHGAVRTWAGSVAEKEDSLGPLRDLVRDGLTPIVWTMACRLQTMAEMNGNGSTHWIGEEMAGTRGAMVTSEFRLGRTCRSLAVAEEYLGKEVGEIKERAVTIWGLARDLEFRGGVETYKAANKDLSQLVPPLLRFDIGEAYGLKECEDGCWRWDLR